jgi:hypothetical protein
MITPKSVIGCEKPARTDEFSLAVWILSHAERGNSLQLQHF